MATNSAYIQIATSNAYQFMNASNNDLVVYPTSSAQQFMIGTSNNTYANMTVTPCNMAFCIQGSTSASAINFNTNNNATSALTILGTGNVGVGSTNPAFKMDVAGTTKSSNFLTAYTGGYLSVFQYANMNTSADPNFPYFGIGCSSNTSIVGVGGWAGLNFYTSTSNPVMTILQGGNVGIGNASPTYKLDISGTGHFTGTVQVDSALTANGGFFVANGEFASATYAGQFSSSAASNDIVVRQASTSNKIHIQTGTSVAGLTINSNNYIGIGTTSPMYILDVVGTPRFSTSLAYIQASGSLTSQLACSNSAGTFFVGQNSLGNIDYYTTAAINMGFAINGVYRMTILSGGNVGIGSTNPGYFLDVAGQGRFQFNNATGGIFAINSNITTTSGNVGANDMIIFGSNLSTYGCGILDYNYFGSANSSNSIGLGLYGANNKLVVQSSGNVGIGMTTPQYTLDVNGQAHANSYFSSVYYVAQSTGTSNVIAPWNSNITIPYYGLALADSVNSITSMSAWGNVNLVTLGNQSINMYGSAITPRLTATSSGIGIFNASPSYTLDVSGTTRTSGIILGTSTDTSRMFSALNSGLANYSGTSLAIGKSASQYNQVEINYNHTGGDAWQANYGSLGLYGMGNVLTWTAYNRVGIGGQTNPQYSLDVTGDINASANLRTGGTTRLDSSGNLTNINSLATGGTTRLDSSGNLTNIGTLATSGQVTINNTSTSTLLVYQGTGSSARATINLKCGACNALAIQQGADSTYIVDSSGNGTGSHYYTTGAAGVYSWNVNNVSKMTMNSSGYLGIGTSSPACPLQITATATPTVTSQALYCTAGTGSGSASWYGTGSQAFSTSIWTAGGIIGSGFAQTSDARVKSNITDFAGTDAINILEKLQVKRYLKVNAGSNIGLIAQEVETILPEAVRTGRCDIPNIVLLYDCANRDGRCLIRAPGVVDVSEGDTVVVILEDGTRKDVVVSSANIEGTVLDIACPDNNKIYVYGKYVDDFRHLNYDQVFCLNLAATQKLIADNKDKDNQIAELRAEIATIKAFVGMPK